MHRQTRITTTVQFIIKWYTRNASEDKRETDERVVLYT